MSRMSLTSRTVDRLQIICSHNKRLSTSPGTRNNATGEGGQRGGGGGGAGASGATGAGEDRHGPAGGPTAGTRVQTAPGGSGLGSGLTKHGRRPSGRLAMTDDGEGGERTEEALGGSGWGDGAEGTGTQDGGTGDNDHSQTLKIKAAQALFRMSLETGGEVSFGIDHLDLLITLQNIPHEVDFRSKASFTRHVTPGDVSPRYVLLNILKRGLYVWLNFAGTSGA